VKLRQEAVERLACGDVVSVVVACDALIARLRRVHQAALAHPDEKGRPPQATIDGAHTENVEALMALLSVIRADGSQPAAGARLSRDLDDLLRGSRAVGIGGNQARP